MAFGRPNSPQNASKTARLGLTECQKFYLVTVTGHLCQSVELIQRVTVTGECRIDRNGTLVQYSMADRGGYNLSTYALAIRVHIYNSLINVGCLHILLHI